MVETSLWTGKMQNSDLLLFSDQIHHNLSVLLKTSKKHKNYKEKIHKLASYLIFPKQPPKWWFRGQNYKYLHLKKPFLLNLKNNWNVAKKENFIWQFNFSHFELQLKHKIAETFHQKVVFKFCQNIPARKEMKCGGQNNKNTSGK